MKKLCVIAITAAFCGAAFAAGPFDQFKGKMKEGLYEYKMNMEVPGMPQGMAMPAMTMQHCVTQKDIEGGDFTKGDRNRQPKDCEFQDMKVSGNTATYKMVCKGEHPMSADTKIVFRDNGFVSDMKMTMNHGGQAMTTNQHMESRYLGACK
ncbi:MAG TPA: DUF3617 family protein [Usitatibacter sp.]|nr:DUF3617 family protein [Usitatibacter sp.]